MKENSCPDCGSKWVKEWKEVELCECQECYKIFRDINAKKAEEDWQAFD